MFYQKYEVPPEILCHGWGIPSLGGERLGSKTVMTTVRTPSIVALLPKVLWQQLEDRRV